MAETKRAACFCGAVQVEVTGDPAVQGFCHCEDCRSWSGTPVTAYALWPAGNVRVVAGADALASFSKTGKAVRHHCKTCGGAVMTESPAVEMIDVYPMLIEGFAFAPAAHIHYGVRVLDMPDGLPKFRDLPGSAGGSDEMIPD